MVSLSGLEGLGFSSYIGSYILCRDSFKSVLEHGGPWVHTLVHTYYVNVGICRLEGLGSRDGEVDDKDNGLEARAQDRHLGFSVYIYELIGMYGLWFIGLYCAGSTLGNFAKP